MKEQILDLRAQKLTINQIAKRLKISTIAVTLVLREEGYLPPNKIKSGGRKNIYNIDTTFFETIDTPSKAYILGFLYADGSISSTKNVIAITLKRADEKLLLDILNCMNSNYKLFYTKERYSKAHPYTEKVVLSICNKRLHDDLIKLQCTPNKSLTLTFPKSVPSNLISHFIRGYFDGDGTIYQDKKGYYRFGIIGTKEFCEDYLKMLNIDIVTIHKEKRTEKNVWYFTISKIKDLELIYQFLYKDATIFLQRKKDKFDSFIKTRKPSTTIIRTPEMEMV